MSQVDLGLIDGHYRFPIRMTGQPEDVPAVLALMDTGASKCVIPSPLNDELHLSIVQRHERITIGNNTEIYYDTVLIPRIEILRPIFSKTEAGVSVNFETTGLYEENVPTWLGGSFILGMNFILKFLITMRPNGMLAVSRG